jgi:uncharacterized protein (DUF924 family)
MSNNMSLIILEVVNFWYSPEVQPLWFVKDPEFDETIRQHFSAAYDLAVSKYKNKLLSDIRTGKEALGLVIIFDQFSRNMFRDTAKAFATDDLALKIAKLAVEKRYDREFTNPAHYNFLYMPYMHSENLQDQEEGIRLFSMIPGNSMTVSYAQQHKDIIERFGRFPHRNQALGRVSTPSELKFLNEFGGF